VEGAVALVEAVAVRFHKNEFKKLVLFFSIISNKEK
jgi:hypothetical protein